MNRQGTNSESKLIWEYSDSPRIEDRNQVENKYINFACVCFFFLFQFSDVRMDSWVIAVKQKTQQIYIRVRTAKKNNNNVAIINFMEVTIAKKGSRL